MNESMLKKIKAYFSTQPIVKAWVFGSYARGEQTKDSDIDIVVRFDKDAKIGLFKYSEIYTDLKRILNLDVDLVQENTFKSLVSKKVNEEKVLIYERG